MICAALVPAESVDLRAPAGPPFQGGRLLIAVTLVSILLTACAAHRPGVPYAPWQLRGTIVDVREDHVRVRHKSGQIVDLVLDDGTAIVSQEGMVTRSALIGGRRVVVSVEPLGDGRARAAHVRIFDRHS